MSRARLIPYGVSILAVAAAVPISLLGFPGPSGLASPFLAAVMLSAWYGGLGPGLLATGLSVLSLDLLSPSLYWPWAGREYAIRLGVFLLAALLISSLNARQRRLEAALRRKDRQKDQLLAVLAHELRNPLSAIVTALRVLRVQGPGDRETAMEDIAERQALNLGRLIDDLLDVSRIGLGKLRLCRTTLDLTRVVTAAVEVVRPSIKARGQRFEVSLPATPVLVDADATRVEQVVVNLLNNAVKYTETGGQIWLRLERGEGCAELRVRDTGMGIAPAVLPHVFDLFVQEEDGARGGLGIGLNLVRSLVRLHGGDVEAFSEGPGRGSEFVVRLPTAAEAGREPALLVPAAALEGPCLRGQAAGPQP